MVKSKSIKVVEKKLGREGAVGQAWQGDNLIEIDPRQTAKEYQLVLCHELFHLYMPEWTEEQVEGLAQFTSDILWKQGYRKVILK